MPHTESPDTLASPLRRTLLGAMLAAPLAARANHFSLEHGVFGACARPIPARLRNHVLVKRAFDGVDVSAYWDCHVHLVGNGKAEGVQLHANFENPLALAHRVRRRMFANGACVDPDREDMDQASIQRMVELLDDFPSGTKALVLAFDAVYAESGERLTDSTTFAVSNRYAAAQALLHPQRVGWICSVHPYRTDAISELEWCAANGAVAIKWLPPAMGIDPASPRCDAFYAKAKLLDLPILTHVGEELAVPGARAADFAHPLRLRRPLDGGVRVIAAHCASLGASADWEASDDPAKQPKVENWKLLERLMREARYDKLLFADISAMLQINRASVLRFVLESSAFRSRLLNGSDYPLPGVVPLTSLSKLVELGLIAADAVDVLAELREHNALLFDFVAKRLVRVNGTSIPSSAFETRAFFARRSAAVAA